MSQVSRIIYVIVFVIAFVFVFVFVIVFAFVLVSVIVFLAVQNSSLGDLVTQSLTHDTLLIDIQRAT